MLRPRIPELPLSKKVLTKVYHLTALLLLKAVDPLELVRVPDKLIPTLQDGARKVLTTKLETKSAV